MSILRLIIISCIYVFVLRWPEMENFRIKFYIREAIIFIIMVILLILLRFIKGPIIEYGITIWLLSQFLVTDPVANAPCET